MTMFRLAALCAIAFSAIGSTAVAYNDKRDRKIEKHAIHKVIIVRSDDESVVDIASEGDKREIKKIVITRGDGSTEEIEPGRIHGNAVKCSGESKRFETAGEIIDGDKKKKTKVVICKGGEGSMIAALEKARGTLASQDALGEGHRAKALAALDAEIARLRADAPADK